MLLDFDISVLREATERSFRTIYVGFYADLCRYAHQFLSDRADVEEVVDDVLVYVWHHRHTIDTPSVRSYLFGLVRNRCFSSLREAYKRHEAPFSTFPVDDAIAFFDTLFSDDHHPLDQLLQREFDARYTAAIESLPPQSARVYVMHRYDQKKYEEIATELGITVNTVKYHITTAHRLLIEHLRRYVTPILALVPHFFIS